MYCCWASSNCSVLSTGIGDVACCPEGISGKTQTACTGKCVSISPFWTLTLFWKTQKPTQASVKIFSRNCQPFLIRYFRILIKNTDGNKASDPSHQDTQYDWRIIWTRVKLSPRERITTEGAGLPVTRCPGQLQVSWKSRNWKPRKSNT